MANNARGENGIALVILHLKDDLGRDPSSEEIKEFVVQNDLLGAFMIHDYEEINRRMQEIEKEKKDGKSSESTR